MMIKDFIRKLEKIAGENGDDAEVIMADNISVVDPIYSIKYPHGHNVIITDKN